MDIEQLNKALAEEKREPIRKLARAIFKQQPPTEIQSLIFNKDDFKTGAAATKWALDHEFKADKVDETESSYRLRQRDPDDFVSTSFRTIEIDDGVSAVIGRLRPELREKTAKKAPAKKRERTREYLERALKLAKEMLPGWAYATLMRTARGHAGGTIRARMRAEEKLLLQKSTASMTDAELEAAYARITGLRQDAVRKNQDVGCFTQIIAKVEAALVKRGILEASAVSKGFVSGKTDGGMHAHGLVRDSQKTAKDGCHQHAFFLPGTGEVLCTCYDGEHEHEMVSKEASGLSLGGKHSHRITLPNGDMVETSIDGGHRHGLMVETTGFDGSHEHQLVMPDGLVLHSVTVTEWIGRFGTPPATTVCDAGMVTEAYADRMRPKVEIAEEFDLPTPETAIVMMAKNNDVVPVFEVVGEVVDAAEEPAVVRFEDEKMDGVYPAHMGDLRPESGDLVNVSYEDGCFTIKSFATTTIPTSGECVEELIARAEQIQKLAPLDFVGPEVAKVAFVAHQPSGLEMARREALVGPDGAKFVESYLEPLGLSKAEVAVGFAVPSIAGKDIDWSARLDAQLSRWPEALVVALGKDARRLLGKRVEVAVPHPGAIRKRGDRGEVGRKLKALRKRLDRKGPIVEYVGTARSAPIPKERTSRTLADLTGGLRADGAVGVQISKSVDDKQIVYGVVLDPYVVDLQGDWIPPADIEATAHDFVEKSRVIGFEHFAKADATLVESSVEPYPTPEDYQAAMQNLPHKVSRRKFGGDVVNSGAWLAGVKLSDGLWEMYKQGKLNAFSIGGFSFKTKVTTSAMPEVEFVDLESK